MCYTLLLCTILHCSKPVYINGKSQQNVGWGISSQLYNHPILDCSYFSTFILMTQNKQFLFGCLWELEENMPKIIMAYDCHIFSILYLCHIYITYYKETQDWLQMIKNFCQCMYLCIWYTYTDTDILVSVRRIFKPIPISPKSPISNRYQVPIYRYDTDTGFIPISYRYMIQILH